MQTTAGVSAPEPVHELASPAAAPARRSSCKQIAKAGAMGGEAIDGSGAGAAAEAAAPTTAAAAAEPQAAAVATAPAQPAPHPVVPPQRREVLLEGFTSPEVTYSPLSCYFCNVISRSLVKLPCAQLNMPEFLSDCLARTCRQDAL